MSKGQLEHRHAQLYSGIFFGISKLLWISVLLYLFVVNYYNFATVFFTLNRDGNDLRLAESLLVKICHRMPSRSFWIFEVPLGLCSRCTGLYLASFFMVAIYPFAKIPRTKQTLHYSIVALLPFLIDSILEHFSFYSGNNILRSATGFLFGYGIVAIVFFFYDQLTHHLNNWR